MNATGEKLLYALVGLLVGAASTYVVMDFLHEKELDDVYAELDGLREDAAEDALAEYAGTDGKVVSIHNHMPPNGLTPRETEDKTRSGGAGGVIGDRVLDASGDTHCTHDVPLNRPCAACEEVVAEDETAEHFIPLCSHGFPVDKECLLCDGELPDPVAAENAHLVEAPWDTGAPMGPGGVIADEEDIIAEDKIEAAALEALAIEDATEDGFPYIIKDNKVTQPTVIGKFNRDDGSFEIAKSMSIAHPDLDEIIENDALYPLIGDAAFDILMESLNEENAPDKLRTIAIHNTQLAVDFVVQY